MFADAARFIAQFHFILGAQAQDFNIPKPADVQNTIPVKPALNNFIPAAATGPANAELIGVTVAAVLLAILFLFLRSGLFNHLIDRRAPPSDARAASWAFYAFLLVTTLTAMAGAVLGLWASIPFLAGGGVVSIALLALFAVSYSGAIRRAK